MTNFLKRAISIMMVVFLLGTVIVGCGTQKSSTAETKVEEKKIEEKKSEPVKEEKVTISAALMCSDFLETAQEIMDKFSEKNPNIKVEFTAMPGEVEEFLQPKAASNSLPDFMSINAGAFGAQLADNGMLADLKDTAIAKNTIDGLKPVFSTTSGKLFGIAGGFSTTSIIYYNKKLFAEAGITEMPTDWDAFLAACEKLKAKNIAPLIYACADGNVSNTIWSNFFAYNIVGKDSSALNKIADGTYNFNTADYADVYAKSKVLFDKDYLIKGSVSLLYAQANDAFMQGKGAMIWSGIWLTGKFMDSDFGTGFFPAPTNEKGKEAIPVIATETGFGVAEGKNKDAALKLLNYITQEEGYYMYQNKRGNIPFQKDYDKSKVKVDADIADFVAKLSTAKVSGPLWFEFLPAEVYSNIPQTYQRVMTGEITADQAAKETDELFKAAKNK